MREKQGIDPTNRDVELREADCRTAASVDKKFLVPGLYQRAWAKAILARNRCTGSEEAALKLLLSCINAFSFRNH